MLLCDGVSSSCCMYNGAVLSLGGKDGAIGGGDADIEDNGAGVDADTEDSGASGGADTEASGAGGGADTEASGAGGDADMEDSGAGGADIESGACCASLC